MIVGGRSVEVPAKVREDTRSVSVEKDRIWSCKLSPSGVFVAQIGIFRIGHDNILREVERKREKARVCLRLEEREKKVRSNNGDSRR